MSLNKMTQYLMSVAASVDNYCKIINKDPNEYASILGYIYRVHQDQIRKVSPQGLALILIYLDDVKEEDYGKYIDVFKDQVDKIIDKSKNCDEQFKKMEKLKSKVK